MKNEDVNDINAKLLAKFEEWVASIEDASLQNLVRANTIITGGAIVSLLLEEKVKDYDVYFKNKETALAVATYYVMKFNAKNPNRKFMVIDGDNLPSTAGWAKWKRNLVKEVLPGMVRIICLSRAKKDYDPEEEYSREIDPDYDEWEDRELLPYRPRFLSHNAITLTDKMQLITRFYGTPDEIHENFDFVHCTNYWQSDDNFLTLRKEALDAIDEKELRYVGSKFPLCSALRVDKFAQRGWIIPPEEWSKIARQILALDLEDPKKLQEQLAGYYSNVFVEMAYELNELKLGLGDDVSVKDILEVINTFI